VTLAEPTPARTQPEAPSTVTVIRRDGSTSPFDESKIAVAMTKAFLAVEGTDAASSSRVHHLVEELTAQVRDALLRHGARSLHIEQIQDQVELALMRGGHHAVARAYVLYREERAKARRQETGTTASAPTVRVKGPDGTLEPLDRERIAAVVAEAVDGVPDTDARAVLAELDRNVYDGISHDELGVAMVMAARTLVEREPNYSQVTARLLLNNLRAEALSFLAGGAREATQAELDYPEYFRAYLARAIDLGQVDPELGKFDLTTITAALRPERDLEFGFLGLQTLYDRYFLHHDGTRYELPQAFFMRVAMGLALREQDREARAVEFYHLLSTFDFMASTPTLFNAGTTRPQLSSCFLTTVEDDLDAIFQSYRNNALLAKYSGGLGNDWTPVRGMGAHIRGTNGQSQGVVPFLKIANDTAVAVNQGGKRKGAACAYLETWHIDIEEFLELRRNTGDDRRRTHDMNTANWIPDEFLRRVEADAEWTLFSPDEVPDLHDLYGKQFSKRYREYEQAVCNLGSVNLARHVTPDGLDTERLRKTVRTAVRMLDNVIDINFYTIPQARRSNLRHRPVGLGLMGYADALHVRKLPVDSPEAVEFADRSMEHLSYYAIEASSELAAERGRYETFDGSLWSRGILPIDSLRILAEHRDGDLDVDYTTTLDWDALRERVRTTGMRNSNVMAIAPTATIANICGVSQSIEPLYQNLYVKSNMSGDFTVINPHLVRELKELGLWDEVMVADLKYFDGSVQHIDRVPGDLKRRYATAFEIDPKWLVRAAARRQKWIDQAQSLNLYIHEPSGRKLDELYRFAWRSGLKTTYYLRARAATSVEKSTLRGTDGKLNAVPVAAVPAAVRPDPQPTACAIDDPDCEACQ